MPEFRDFQIAGETMVYVRGRPDVETTLTTAAFSGQSLAPWPVSKVELGLAAESITVRFQIYHRDVKVNAWGGRHGMPADVQNFGATAEIDMTLVHYSPGVLDACVQESMGGAVRAGKVVGAGTLMGGNMPRWAAGGVAGNHYISLTLLPSQIPPYRFPNAYLTAPPLEISLGSKKTAARLTWRAIAYASDPWDAAPGAGTLSFSGGASTFPTEGLFVGAVGNTLYDRFSDV